MAVVKRHWRMHRHRRRRRRRRRAYARPRPHMHTYTQTHVHAITQTHMYAVATVFVCGFTGRTSAIAERSKLDNATVCGETTDLVMHEIMMPVRACARACVSVSVSMSVCLCPCPCACARTSLSKDFSFLPLPGGDPQEACEQPQTTHVSGGHRRHVSVDSR